MDTGWVINPDTIKAQMEGGIVYGLTAALKGEITIKNGRVEQRHFNDYQVMRHTEMPQIDVYIVPKHVFEQYDVDFKALGEFGAQGAVQYMEGVEAGVMDPYQALLSMWFGGAKLGMLIRDEQRRRVVDEMGSLDAPDSPPEDES